MTTNMDLALALGFIVLVLICVVAEGFYFLQLPIRHKRMHCSAQARTRTSATPVLAGLWTEDRQFGRLKQC